MSARARNLAAVALILISFACLVPGLYRPVLTIDISPVLPFFGKLTIYQKTRSILSTVKNLYDLHSYLVSGLILLFSVIVPFVKGLILLYVLSFRNGFGRARLFHFVSLIGRWSMADVFTVAIFLAYLAANAVEGISAQVHDGFWFFLSYCLLSVLSAQLMTLKSDSAPAAE